MAVFDGYAHDNRPSTHEFEIAVEQYMTALKALYYKSIKKLSKGADDITSVDVLDHHKVMYNALYKLNEPFDGFTMALTQSNTIIISYQREHLGYVVFAFGERKFPELGDIYLEKVISTNCLTPTGKHIQGFMHIDLEQLLNEICDTNSREQLLRIEKIALELT
ncbi:MAG: hypothetical protein R3250_11200 [Melioribacteraceae bacterium]|nr:hypothetical protein [Melioribacteraceae bacterium]